MKMNKSSLERHARQIVGIIASVAMLWFLCNVTQAAPQITIRYFVLTAANSPNNSESQQNVMTFMDDNGDIGTLDTDIADYPGALNMPHVLRPVDFMYSTFNMWDGTNNPAGNFSGEYGKRLGVGLKWTDTNLFLVTGIWFHLQSTNDGNNDALLYAGDLGTNTSSPYSQLTFSPTLKGGLLDTNGNVTWTYSNGQSLTNQVNCVEALIKVGWLCSSNADITSDLRFFSSHINPPFTETATFYDDSGNSASAVITSQPYPLISVGPGGTNVDVIIEGQRQLEPYVSLSYNLQQKPLLCDTNYDWVTVVTNLQDSSVFYSPPFSSITNNQSYYRAVQVATHY